MGKSILKINLLIFWSLILREEISVVAKLGRIRGHESIISVKHYSFRFVLSEYERHSMEFDVNSLWFLRVKLMLIKFFECEMNFDNSFNVPDKKES